MSTKKKAATKTATDEKKSTTALNQPLPEGMLGTKEVAAKLGIEPRHLRVVLRSLGKGTGGERYMWKRDSPELHKIAEAVKEHDAKVKEETAKK